VGQVLGAHGGLNWPKMALFAYFKKTACIGVCLQSHRPKDFQHKVAVIMNLMFLSFDAVL
jgi:hypothetical protein